MKEERFPFFSLSLSLSSSHSIFFSLAIQYFSCNLSFFRRTRLFSILCYLFDIPSTKCAFDQLLSYFHFCSFLCYPPYYSLLRFLISPVFSLNLPLPVIVPNKIRASLFAPHLPALFIIRGGSRRVPPTRSSRSFPSDAHRRRRRCRCQRRAS